MENKDYGEIFCQAVDEIVEQRIETIKFDSTILCTIVDDSWRDTGKYIVTNNGGITKFEAFSENTNYRNNNNVYVQIPGGDWDQQKIIIGKKTDKTEEPYNYIKPFSSLIDITGNLINSNIERKETGLIANQEIIKTADGKVSEDQEKKEYRITLWSYNIEDSEAKHQESGLPHSGYTRLGIQADFQSWLNTFYSSTGILEIDSIPRSVIQGNYGLRLVLTAKREAVAGENEEELAKATYILELNVDDMNGNPYNFESFYTQQKLFDISEIGEIQTLELQFYETTGTFVDNEGYYISDVDFLGNLIMPNLYVNNIYISLGYDVNEINEERVQIYTLDSTTYSRTADPLTNNHKKLQVRWIHKMENGTYKSITSNDNIGDYTVYWYRYKLGNPSADQFSGVYWKYLSIQDKDSNEIADPDWKNYNVNSEIDDCRYPTFFSSWAIPDITLQQEQYKAIIIYNGKPYRSNILTFQNKEEVVNNPTIEAIQALTINCEDKTFGNYRIYNQGNRLLDQAQSSVKRQWKVYFNNTELTEAESIEWIIPLTKTMLTVTEIPEKMEDKDGRPFYYYDETDKIKTHIHIFKYGDPSNGYAISESNTLSYRIGSYYTQTYSNNTIQCKVIKEKVAYVATKEMTFGIAGTTGTDCTFILDFDDSKTAVLDRIYSKDDEGNTIVIDEEETSVTVTARLYDYENNEVDISDKEITWGWKAENSLFELADIYDEEDNTKIISYRHEVKRKEDTKTPDDFHNYSILQATLTGWGDYDLVAYLPIPLKSKKDYDYISGTTQVIYNSDGELMDYFKNPYVLYENAEPVSSVSWDCIGTDTDTYRPKVITKNGDSWLSPLSFYVENSCKEVCVVGKMKDGNYWSQPLLIMTNRYPSAMINKWDGQLNIGELDKGTILAPRLVAGSKDGDNKFSGVVLGDWGKTDSDKSLTTTTGLYGYSKGEQSYAFKEDGTAFIGKSGAGRIQFDGNEGIIQSAAYNAETDEEDGTGMSINLAEGTIDAHTFTLTAGKSGGKIVIDSTADTKPFAINEDKFFISWDGKVTAKEGEIAGWKIYQGELAPSDYYKENESGKNWYCLYSIPNENLETKKEETGGIFFDATRDYPLAINVPGKDMFIDHNEAAFKVGRDGALYIGGNKQSSPFYVKSDGTMKATKGQIAGWKFYSGQDAPQDYSNDKSYNWNCLYSDGIFFDPTKSYPLAIGIPSEQMFIDHGWAAFKVGSDGALYIGSNLKNNVKSPAPFSVDANGNLYASSGTIAGWTISSDGFSSTNGTTTFTISPSGTINNVSINSAKIDKATITEGSIDAATITNAIISSGKIGEITIEKGSLGGTDWSLSKSGYVTDGTISCAGLHIGGADYGLSSQLVVTKATVNSSIDTDTWKPTFKRVSIKDSISITKSDIETLLYGDTESITYNISASSNDTFIYSFTQPSITSTVSHDVVSIEYLGKIEEKKENE